ncbi:Hypothetical predicted protein, partial [Paramuricea clavata]
DSNKRKTLTRFRLSNHSLQIETVYFLNILICYIVTLYSEALAIPVKMRVYKYNVNEDYAHKIASIYEPLLDRIKIKLFTSISINSVCSKRECQASTLLNQDSVLNERLNKLKNALSAYRGHLTRSYPELKESMSDPNKYAETITRRDALSSIFESYKEASVKYSEYLEREEDKKAVQKLRESEVLRYTEFIRIYSEWLRNLSEIFRPNRNFSLFHELSSRTNCKKTKRNFVSRCERRKQETERFETNLKMSVTSRQKRMELPKREFLYFDGNPVNYTTFMRNFELNVENRVQETSVKLSFLIQYTSGTAREAIENCVILPADEGYAKAKEILRKNFGQKHIIVRAFIERVTKGPQIKPGEPDKLMQLARDMRNCLLNSTQLNYKADINAMDTLSKIVKKLPSYLQAKWAERSGTLIGCDIEPEFQHFTEFVEKNASTANTTFGKLVGAKPDDDNKNKFRPRISNKGTLGVTRSTETQTSETRPPGNVETTGYKDNNSHPARKQVRCVTSFGKKTHKERMHFVRKEKLCDNCLRRNHLAKRCRFNPACMISGCGRKHHSLLHPPSKSENEFSEGKKANRRQKVSLRIVPVKVKNEDGTREIETYAFIDNGSDTTLCSRDLLHELNLSSKPCEFTLTTVNGQDKSRNGQEVKLNIQSLNGDGSIQLDRVGTVESLPISEQCIPTVEEINSWSHLSDIEFPKLENANVTILIGSDVSEAHWIFEERRGRPRESLASRTLLGWTLLGPVGSVSRQEVNKR